MNYMHLYFSAAVSAFIIIIGFTLGVLIREMIKDPILFGFIVLWIILTILFYFVVERRIQNETSSN